jgi:outer membrane usher protein
MSYLAPAYAQQADSELLLEVWINGYNRHETVRAKPLADGSIAADCADLAAAGIRVDEKAQTCTLAADEAKIDMAEQRLLITAGEDRLLPSVFSAKPEAVDRAGVARTGALSGASLTYEATTQTSDFTRFGRTGSVGVSLNGAVFGNFGAVLASGFGDAVSGAGRIVSLDNTYVYENPDTLHRFAAGDTITSGLAWSRPVRFGGFQLQTDFSLQPDLITQPMPRFFGQSAVPSTLDVFVNNTQVFEEHVDPGPFEIRDLPVVNGSGLVTVSTRDELGRQTIETLPLYASDRLLATDLTAFSVEAGWLRLDYGVHSMVYGDFIASGTVRHGWKDWITVEGHAEFGEGIALGGAGASIRMAPLGVLSLAVAASGARGSGGMLGDVSFEAQPFDWLSLNGEITATGGDYRDLASLNGSLTPAITALAGANFALGEYGSLSLSWIYTRTQKREPPQTLQVLPFLAITQPFPFSVLRSQSIHASYSVPIGKEGLSLNLSGYHDLVRGTSGAEIFITMPIGESTYASGSARFSQDNPQLEADVTQSPPSAGGFGYRATLMDGPVQGGEANAIWDGEAVSLNANVSLTNHSTAGRIGASGALVLVADDLEATRRIDGAFALVEAGQPGVHVFQENREVGVSGTDGNLLIAGLTPYGRNHLSVSPDDYPMDVDISAPERVVIPNRFGAVVDFAPMKSSAALVSLRLPDGSEPPLGTLVSLDAQQEPLVVGAHGKIFIHDLAAAVHGHVQLPEGSCGFVATPPPARTGDAIPEIGPLTCTMETGNATSDH